MGIMVLHRANWFSKCMCIGDSGGEHFDMLSSIHAFLKTNLHDAAPKYPYIHLYSVYNEVYSSSVHNMIHMVK